MKKNSTARRGILLAFLGAAFWGFSANCVSWLTTYTQASIFWLADMRLIFAGALFLILSFLFEREGLKHLIATKRLWPATVGYIILGVLLMQISYMSAIKYTNPGTALLLQESGVLMIMVYSCVRARRKPRNIEIVALILATVGILMISCQGDIRTLDINPLGLMWGLASGVALAGYNIVSVDVMDECGLMPLNAVSMLIGAIVLLPFAQPWEVPIGFALDGWLVLGGVVIVGTVLAYAVYLKGVMYAGPVRASLIGVFEPISGAVIAALWLGTAFTGWDFAGGVAIILMMILVARSS